MTKIYTMKKVTIFSAFNKTLENIELDDFLQQVKNGTYSEMVLQVRQLLKQGEKEKAQLTKKQLRAVTISAIYCGGRKEGFMTEYQGTLVMDIDDITPEELIRIRKIVNADAHTYASFESPGGGLKIIVMVTDMNKSLPQSINEIKLFHKQMYNEVMQYYQSLTGVNIDVSGKDITRLCFYSYDPEMYLNHEAVPFMQSTTPITAHTLNPKRIDKVFKEVLQKMNETEQYTEGNRNNFVYLLANMLNRKAVPRTWAYSLCIDEFKDIDTTEITTAIDSAYSHTEEFGAFKKDKKKVQMERVQAFLTEHYEVRYNVVSTKIEIRTKGEPAEGTKQSTEDTKQPAEGTKQSAEVAASIAPTEDKKTKRKSTKSTPNDIEEIITDQFTTANDRIEASIWRAANNAGIKVNITIIRQLLNSDLFGQYNPFVDYFYSLPEWDGKDYIGQLAATIHTDNDDAYWRFCLEKWITAMVASLLDKEVVNHLMIILNSSQGLGKTQWIQKVLPPELNNYFALASLVGNEKDLLLKFCYHALILLDELDALSQRELGLVKKLITQSAVDERKAYAHNEEKYIRYASLMATTNNHKMLSDPTGSRRFAPFNITKMDYLLR